MPRRNRQLDSVFISYSHVDSIFVDDVTGVLDELSIPYFRDNKDIHWGANIDAEVSEALSSSSHLILVLSPASQQSAWVPYELGQARALDIVILPLLTHPSLQLPDYLSGIRYLSSVADLRTELDAMTRRAVPITVSLEVGHSQPAGDDDGKYWGMQTFDEGEEVEGAWVPYLAIIARSEARYAVSVSEGFFEFSEPGLQLVADAYRRLSNRLESGNDTLNPRGEVTITFPTGIVTNSIARAIGRQEVESFGVETGDGLAVLGPLEDLEAARQYIERFFADVDTDAVYQAFGIVE